MEKFFLGEDLAKAERVARLLHRLTGRTIYLNEDFGSEQEDDPWGFFVSTNAEKDLYCQFGGERK